MDRQRLIKTILLALRASDDLRRPEYQGSPNYLRGHCYVASETLYHMFGGKDSGLNPFVVSHEGSNHWFLVDEVTTQLIDVTANQFMTPVPYPKARRKGFLTTKPSKRAVELMRRVRRLLYPN